MSTKGCGFIRIGFNRLLNPSNVREITETEVGMNDYSGQKITKVDFDQFFDQTIELIPAQPGFYVHEAIDNLDGTFFETRVPIIGWRVLGGSVYKPVTVEDTETETLGKCIVYPDGQCVELENRSWENLDEWREYIKDVLVKTEKED